MAADLRFLLLHGIIFLTFSLTDAARMTGSRKSIWLSVWYWTFKAILFGARFSNWNISGEPNLCSRLRGSEGLCVYRTYNLAGKRPESEWMRQRKRLDHTHEHQRRARTAYEKWIAGVLCGYQQLSFVIAAMPSRKRNVAWLKVNILLKFEMHGVKGCWPLAVPGSLEREAGFV